MERGEIAVSYKYPNLVHFGETNSMYKHGLSHTRFNVIWKNIKMRCYNKKSDMYYIYGKNNIKMSDRWKDFNNFIDDMYDSYLKHVEEFGEKDTQIDRINNKLGYSKDNCRWATIKEQANNKKNNIKITYMGKEKTLAQWCDELNINRGLVYGRIYDGWEPLRAMLTQKGKYGN